MSCAPTELWAAVEPQRGDRMDRLAVSTPAEKTDNTESNPGGVTGIIVAVSENLFIFASEKIELCVHEQSISTIDCWNKSDLCFRTMRIYNYGWRNKWSRF